VVLPPLVPEHDGWAGVAGALDVGDVAVVAGEVEAEVKDGGPLAEAVEGVEVGVVREPTEEVREGGEELVVVEAGVEDDAVGGEGGEVVDVGVGVVALDALAD